MTLPEQLLQPLKQQVNAVEFDADDALLTRNLKRALGQLLSVCRISIDDLQTARESLNEEELECGIPADFAGAVLELAAAMYRYGEAYADTSYRFTPAFDMVVSKYRKPFNPFADARP